MVTGGYLYVIGFVPTAVTLEESLTNLDPDYVIVAEEYGGCETDGACAAFQLRSDGQLRFSAGGNSELLETEITPSQLEEVNSAIRETNFVTASELVEPVSCPSFGAGNDLLYEITAGDQQFSLDTCGTRFSTESAFAQAMSSIWQVFDEE